MNESPRLDLSVIIITFNEENSLARCLRSLPACREVIIVDSHSSDSTREIARAYGAQVYEHPFTNYAEQKNRALAYARTPWVLSLDADEEVSAALREEITALLSASTPPAATAYSLRRQLHFLGKPLRFGHTSDRPLRLFRRQGAHFIKPVHEELTIAGSHAHLHEPLLHYSYSDLSDYLQKFNRYTSHAAASAYERGRRASLLDLLVRPWLTFFLRYVIRLGVLDGLHGYSYALLSSFYVFAKYAKLRDLARTSSTPMK